jgi:hypothetical protein
VWRQRLINWCQRLRGRDRRTIRTGPLRAWGVPFLSATGAI